MPPPAHTPCTTNPTAIQRKLVDSRYNGASGNATSGREVGGFLNRLAENFRLQPLDLFAVRPAKPRFIDEKDFLKANVMRTCSTLAAFSADGYRLAGDVL